MPRSAGRQIDREIGAIAVPAALALATDPLYDLCDAAILGHIGSAELAGAALAGRILAFGYAAFVFLMFGTTAAVARHRGAGDERAASSEAVGAIWIALGLGLLAAAVFGLAGRPLIGLLGGDGADAATVAGHAWTYLAVSLAGIPAFMIVMVGVGFLRGAQNTRTPLAIAALTVTVNLVLELVLVIGLGFSVGASALGTVIAKWLGAAIYLRIIWRAARHSGASLAPRRSTVFGHLVVGRDLVARTVVLLLVITVAQALAARLGVSTLTAHVIAFQVWMFGAYASDGLEVAGQSMIANRLGAGRGNEVRQVARRLAGWSVALGLGFAVVVGASATVIPRLFTADAEVIGQTVSIMAWVAALQPINAVAFALDGILVGAAEQRYLAGSMAVAGAGFAVVAVLANRADAGLAGIWAALSVFMVIRCASGALRARLL